MCTKGQVSGVVLSGTYIRSVQANKCRPVGVFQSLTFYSNLVWFPQLRVYKLHVAFQLPTPRERSSSPRCITSKLQPLTNTFLQPLCRIDIFTSRLIHFESYDRHCRYCFRFCIERNNKTYFNRV